MKLPLIFSLAATVLVEFVSLADPARAEALSLVGSSEKVCQLVGETDWQTGQPTAARTVSNFGLAAVDLGFPVDSGAGPLFFLFGDALPDQTPLRPVPPDDAIGVSTRKAAPDSVSCLDLRLIVSAPKVFAHPTVEPPIQQGAFNVPTGGVFLDDRFYAFFWTNHCVFPGVLRPDPEAPLTPPPATGVCRQIPLSNSVGASVLAEAAARTPALFHAWTSTPPFEPLREMPSGFVYVSAAKPPVEIGPLRPEGPREGIPVFGAARYRASIPYLAVAPRETFADPRSWAFFAGLSGGKPVWLTRDQWESGRNLGGRWKPPAGAEMFDAALPGDRCVGEHSVTWNEPLKKWLLVYNCDPPAGLHASGAGIQARVASEPWGPWSAPITLLNAAHDPGALCALIMSPGGCPGRVSVPSGRGAGFFYAPFVIDRFTQNETPPGPGQPKRTTIYWVVSTWNPYYVVVMRSTLELK
jgi:hypothetical protein